MVGLMQKTIVLGRKEPDGAIHSGQIKTKQPIEVYFTNAFVPGS